MGNLEDSNKTVCRETVGISKEADGLNSFFYDYLEKEICQEPKKWSM